MEVRGVHTIVVIITLGLSDDDLSDGGLSDGMVNNSERIDGIPP
jgi:hypothetical protein